MPGSEDMIDIMDQVRSSINLGDKRLERAIEALEQGRIFRELDLPNKSMKAYNDALDMWQRNGNEVRQFIGDFSISEIKTFNRRDCELMVKLLLAKASFAETAFVRKSAECYLKAIEIFEFAPSMDSVKDRSMIYPCFHSLFRLLREGRLDRDLLFERALAARFVQESKASSCYHHSCALAISAEMKARSGLIPEALEDVDTMSHIYRTEADSKAIQGVSGLDICLITHSRAALWFIELGDESAALNKCEFVINAIQHQNCGITDAYVVEVHSVLLPVIIILRAKCQGERMKYLYERKMLPHVEDSTMPIFVRNMLLVLSLSNVDNTESKKVDTEISKMIEQKEFSQEFDHFYISMGMSQNTLAAEACLYLARRRDDMSSSLIDKGLAFALFARRTIAENSHIIGTMAQNKNQKVFLDLSKLANEIGIDVDQGQEMKRISSDLIYTSFNRQIRPTLMLRAKKTLPHQLLLRHDTVAFVGLTHDSLAGVFRKAISEVPGKTWSSVYICYTADSLLGAFVSPNLVDANAEDEVEDFRKKKLASKTDLSALLTHCVDELHFYEVNHHCFFGSWFGWREEGGYIHISPSVWGVDVKLCPSQSYTWEPDHAPSPDYNAFRQGIENVIERASSYSTELEPRYHVLQKS